MPYRGKPSKGCATCRQRKIRCDQRTPGCQNCEKLGRTCPGYRDQTELMFLDETADVAEKARRSSATSRTSQSTPEPEKQSSRDLRPTASTGDTPRSLSPDVESRATAFFFENFAVDGNQSAQSPFFVEASFSTSPGARALLHSIRALGLAGLARYSDTPHLMRTAEAQYLNAIRSMNAGLGIPEEAKKDSTLLAVLILTIFETVAVSESHTLTAWSNHVQGAAALLDARGPQQFDDPDGFRLFIQATIPICTNCITQGIRPPEPIIRLLEEAKARIGYFDPVMKHFEHKVVFADFFGQVRLRELTDFEVIISKAQELDEDAAANLRDIKPPWAYHVIESDKDDQTPLGYYHLYDYFLGAELWNAVRAIRLLLNQMIRSILLLGFMRRPPVFTKPAHTELLQRATDNMYALQDDVIASVPQYMGWVGEPKGKEKAIAILSSSRPPSPPEQPAGTSTPSTRFLWSNFSTSIYTLANTPTLNCLPLIRSNGVGHLPWVLFLLGSIDIATDQTRNWALARLKGIGTNLGTQQATVLAERMERGEMNEAWYRNPANAAANVGGEGRVGAAATSSVAGTADDQAMQED